MLFCDAGFYAMKLIKEKLGKRVCAFGLVPSMETSKDVPPNFVGLKPARTALAGSFTRACGQCWSGW